MRVIVLINAAAGSGGPAAAGGTPPEQIAAAFRAAGVEAELRPTPGEELGTAAAKAACEQGIGAVVAVGGDGTVSTVASALVSAGCPVPLGVLPLGTLNHFAKDAKIPLDLGEAARTIAAGHVRTVDVGEVNGHLFINNCSIGIYPQLVTKRERQRRRLGSNKWLAMAAAVLSIFRRFPVVQVVLDMGGRAVSRTTPFVFVGNNAYDVQLFSLGTRPRLDAGELSLYFSHRRGRFAMVLLAIRAIFGLLEQSRDFESMALPAFRLDTRKKTLKVALDGEVTRLQPPLHFRSRPGALRVIAPDAPAPGEHGG